MGGGKTTEETKPLANRIVPHPRTLRKAREQVKQMVIDGGFLPDESAVTCIDGARGG